MTSTMFRIKRIYDPFDPTDGTRVLVDRLWPRGVTKRNAQIDLWLKEIAPSPALRAWFAHDPARWTDFQRRYRRELQQQPSAVARLRDLGSLGPLTLIYAAHDTVHNHARVLAEYLDHLSGEVHVDPAA
ncbi:MAG: DUF488 domain-containing protein [Hyphomicrobiales bacterium]|nr:MAG: DUF488 domain-containing protein [Hyphomicrobiales bacterium]